MNRKWAIAIGALIVYITLYFIFGHIINLVLVLGGIAWYTYKHN